MPRGKKQRDDSLGELPAHLLSVADSLLQGGMPRGRVYDIINELQNSHSAAIADDSSTYGETNAIHRHVLREKVRHGELLIELDEVASGSSASQSRSNAFEKGMELIRNCAQEVYSNAMRMPESAQPSSMGVEFAVRFNSDGDAVLSSSPEHGQLRVSMQWTASDHSR